MKKIPTLFVRDFEHDNGRYVTEEVTPGCEWVLAGEGVPTRKYDGTCVMLDAAGEWWARREVKQGKPNPAGFQPIETDGITGKTVGWEPIAQSPFAKFHAEALAGWEASPVPDVWGDGLPPGTYELIGPKINGNPEGCDAHELEPHAEAEVMPLSTPLTFETIRRHVLGYNRSLNIEGIVWHHPDGRMAKIKARDFRR